MTTIEEIVASLSHQKTSLDQTRQAITRKTQAKFDQLISQNATEAREKDQRVEELLTFFHAMGFDAISQSKLDTLITAVNIDPRHYGLQQPIDFAQGSLGFDYDF